MNLDEKLVDILEKTMLGVEKGADFLSAEIPEVLAQLLLWYGVYYSLLTVGGIVLLVGAYFLARLPKPGKRLSKTPDSYGGYKSIPTWSHGKWGTPDVGAVTVWVVSAFAALIGVLMMNITWLQILIAPKLWLIEYTASLVK